MRETLTALAIVLIVALSAALAGPYLVDWNTSRGFLEARLSHALGQKVTIGGAIDLKLLPTPYLILDQAVIGDDDGPISMGIRHLHLELAVTPLLHGEFEIVEARLAEPTIRITLQRDRSFPALPKAPAFDADVHFDRITVADGTLAIADPESGRTFALEHLDFEAEAQSPSGALKASGSAGPQDARTNFRFASSGAQNGKAHSRLVLDETPAHAGLDLDGTLSLAGKAGGELIPTFAGTIAVSGHARNAALDLLAWRLAGTIGGDVHRVALQSGELRLGAEEHGVLFTASGEADFGDEPSMRLELSGKQLDLDRLLASDAAQEAGSAPLPLPRLADWRGSVDPPFPTTIGIKAATATYGGGTLSNLEGAFTVGGKNASPLHVAADGPGTSHLSISGTAQTEPHAFAGTIAAASSDIPTLTEWLRRIAPDVAWPTSPVRAAEVQAEVQLDGAGIDLRTLAMRFGRSSLTGHAHYALAQGQRPAVLSADLQAPTLDIDTIPDFDALRTASAAWDLDVRLDARAVKLARVSATAGPLDTGRIRLALTKSASRFALDAFHVEGLGGATIDASASLDPSGGHLDAKLDAVTLSQAAALFARAAPSVWTEALTARAPALGPAKLAISAVLKPLDAPGGPMPRAMTVNGSFGATRIDMNVAPDSADDRKIVATASASAPEGSALLRQLGVPTLSLNLLGASRIGVEARGPPDASLAATAHASLGSTEADFSGQVSASKAMASGTARLVGRDVSPLLQSLAIAFPDFIGHTAADLSASLSWTQAGVALADLKGRVGAIATSGSLMWHAGPKTPAFTGALAVDRVAAATLFSLALGPGQQPAANAQWSGANFGAGLIDPPAAALDVSAGTLDLGFGLAARNATFKLGIAQGLVSLEDMRAVFGGGTLQAHLALRRDGASAALEGGVALSKVALALPSAAGTLSAHLDVAGSGRSAAALVAGLAGTGEAAVDDLRVPHADPAALPKIFDDVEADRLSVEEDSVSRAFEDQSTAALAAGPRSFMLGLAAGVLHLDPKDGSATGSDPVRSSISGSLDLRQLTLETRVEQALQALQALPKNWSGPPPEIVTLWSGPIRAPVRTADDSAFINALAARALARESARIEAYELDARERAFFNQRLQADRRREQDRLKAEDDARRAEAERRAREAAARLERIRKAEDAARAADRALQEKAAHEAAEQQARDRAARARDQRPASAPQPTTGNVDQPGFRSPQEPTDPSSAGRY